MLGQSVEAVLIMNSPKISNMILKVTTNQRKFLKKIQRLQTITQLSMLKLNQQLLLPPQKTTV